MLNQPLFFISWNAIISGFNSIIASLNAFIVESPFVGKNSQFHVMISKPFNLLILGKSHWLLVVVEKVSLHDHGVDDTHSIQCAQQ